ncbi:MAG: HAD family phosphatase [Anaerolineae bacterium]
MIRAIIVDMDGTLIDSTRAHALSWQEALANFGKVSSLEEIVPLLGKGPGEITAALWGEEAEAGLIEEITEMRQKIFAERYRQLVEAFPKAREFLCLLKDSGRRIVLASCAHQEDVEYFIGSLGLRPCINEYVSADDVDRCKPRPDIFELALRRADVEPQEAVAIGDSVHDVLAARALGIPVIALLSSGAKEERLKAAGASEICNDVRELLKKYRQSLLVKT